MSDKAKILDKIKKCLALSKSPEPHEAAAALRQARKLMEIHGIDEHDLSDADYVSETVDVPIQVSMPSVTADVKRIMKGKKPRSPNPPRILEMVVALMMRAFGVNPVFEMTRRVSDYSWTIRYFGPATRVPVAAYTHRIVWRALTGAWNGYLKAHPEIKGVKDARTSFMVGWIAGVAQTVERFATPDNEAAAIARAMGRHYGRTLAVTEGTSKQKLYGSLMSAGGDAAADFSIHRPMHSEKNRLEHQR